MKDKATIVRIKREAIMDAYQGLPTMDRTGGTLLHRRVEAEQCRDEQ